MRMHAQLRSRVHVATAFCLLLGASLVATARQPLVVDSWAYQLQNYDQAALEALKVDLLVVDAPQIEEAGINLKTLQRTNKRVVSYLSIGEAEDYREYWNTEWSTAGPEWLGPENTQWRGNYKVKFWHGEWQTLMATAIQKVAHAGYDGVFLDVVDAYAFWEKRGVTDARVRMIEFVSDLAAAARRVNPDFVIIAQNAPELTSTPQYLDLIDAQAVEDLWFDGDRLNSPVDVRWTLNQLEPTLRSGKPVLSVDYVTRFHTVADYCRRGRAHGLVPFTAPRSLDAIPDTPHRQCPRPGMRVAAQ